MHCKLLLLVAIPLTFETEFTYSLDQYGVYDKIFLDQDYKPELRPVKNISDPVDVLVIYYMTSVNDLDETNEILSSTGWLDVRWEDQFLTWEKSMFNNLDVIRLPAELAWTPDLALFNDNERQILLAKLGTFIILHSNGSIVWWVPAHWRTKCHMDITKFPFDTQSCPIVIGQMSSAQEDVSIRGHASGKLEQLFQKHGEWEVTNLSIVNELDNYDGVLQSKLTVNIVLVRRPLYHIVTNILPVVALSVLNLATFLVPVECGEKISLCVSVLLSYAVFLSAITSNLPKVSNSISVFGIYLLVMLIIKVTSCFIAVFVLKFNFKQKSEYRIITSPSITECVCQPSEVTSLDKAVKLNQYSFYAILCLTAVMTVSFFCWMVMGQ